MVITIVLISLAVLLATKAIVELSESEYALRISEIMPIPIIALLMLFVLIVLLETTGLSV